MKLRLSALKLALSTGVLICTAALPSLAGDGAGAVDMFASSLKTLGALVLVLALILVIAWIARRYLHFLPQSAGKDEDIRILSGKALGPKRSVHLLEVEGHKLLVGSTEEGVTLLKEFGNAVRQE